MSLGLWFSLATSVLWAGAIVNRRSILSAGENPLNLEAWISIILIVPWSFLFYRHRKEFIALSWRYKFLLLFIGVAVSFGIDYLQALALANTSAVNFSFLYRTIVVFTIVFAHIFFKEPITYKKGVLAAIILIGSYFLTTNGRSITLTKGDIFTLMMAASAAFISNILIKHTIAKMHPDLSGAAISFVAAATLLTFGGMRGVLRVPNNFPLILLGVILSFGITLVRNRAYKHATASFVTMIVSLTPVFVALFSYPLLGERLDPLEFIGGLIIVGSTFFVEKFRI